MEPLEIISALFAALVLLRVAIAMFYPKKRIRWIKKAIKKRGLIKGIYLAIVVVVGYFMFKSMSMIDIAPVILWSLSLFGLVLVNYEKALLKLIDNIPRTREEILEKQWVNILIWVGMSLWIIYILAV